MSSPSPSDSRDRHVDPDAADAASGSTNNRLLAGVSFDGLERVRPRMRQLLQEQGAPIEHVYFPEGGVFSLLARMSDGAIIETLTVGSEGMIGLSAVLGAKRSSTRAICQIAGRALRAPTAVVLEAAAPGTLLHERCMRYAEAQLASLTWSVACNRLHSATQRYARWVLTTQDRVRADEFPLTQDFLAQMLGVTRPTISAVGQELKASGLIHFEQGRMTVDDRRGLEQVSCECYAIIRAAFDELLGGQPRG